MADRQRGIDEIIKKAIQEGAFKQLPGEGQPFNWDESATIDDDWQLAYHLLKENGFAPDFIETRKAIEADLATARQDLKRSFDWKRKALEADEDPEMLDSQWAKAKSTFEDRVGELNNQIRDYNLTIPLQVFYMETVSAAREIAGLTESRKSS